MAEPGADHEVSPKQAPLLILKPGVGEYKHTFVPIEKLLKESDTQVVVDEQAKPGRKKELKAEFINAKARAKKLYAELYPGKIDEAELERLIDAIPLSVFRQALSVIRLAEEHAREERSIVLAGHSMGAAAVLAAAFLRPDLNVTKLILINPAGWTDKRERESAYLKSAESINAKRQKRFDAMLAGQWRAANLFVRVSFTLFVAEFVANLARRDEKGARMLGAVRDGIRYLAERVLNGQIFAEAYDLANFDSLPLLDFLHKTSGLSVDVVYDEGDSIFPARGIRRRVREENGKRKWMTLHKTKHFGHYGPVKDPAYFARLIQSLLMS